jgi:hypothetical protein
VELAVSVSKLDSKRPIVEGTRHIDVSMIFIRVDK